MNFSHYSKKIVWTNRTRCDVTPIFRDPKMFQQMIVDMTKPFKNTSIDVVVGLDALGFVFATAVAQKLGCAFVPIRKRGKLPYPKKDLISSVYTDYSQSQKTFELQKDAIKKRQKVLIVDEWIETGASAKAAIKLVEKLGGIIAGITVLAAEKSERTRILYEKYNVHAIGIFDTRHPEKGFR